MPILGFKDLNVYQTAYQAALIVIKEIVPNLPKEEKCDLCRQLRRSSKAIPALIAEGYAKKHQPKAFQGYLVDALGEANEMIVHLSYCLDLYGKFINT